MHFLHVLPGNPAFRHTVYSLSIQQDKSESVRTRARGSSHSTRPRGSRIRIIEHRHDANQACTAGDSVLVALVPTFVIDPIGGESEESIPCHHMCRTSMPTTIKFHGSRRVERDRIQRYHMVNPNKERRSTAGAAPTRDRIEQPRAQPVRPASLDMGDQ